MFVPSQFRRGVPTFTSEIDGAGLDSLADPPTTAWSPAETSGRRPRASNLLRLSAAGMVADNDRPDLGQPWPRLLYSGEIAFEHADQHTQHGVVVAALDKRSGRFATKRSTMRRGKVSRSSPQTSRPRAPMRARKTGSSASVIRPEALSFDEHYPEVGVDCAGGTGRTLSATSIALVSPLEWPPTDLTPGDPPAPGRPARWESTSPPRTASCRGRRSPLGKTQPGS